MKYYVKIKLFKYEAILESFRKKQINVSLQQDGFTDEYYSLTEEKLTFTSW